jgi:hypothetical protein
MKGRRDDRALRSRSRNTDPVGPTLQDRSLSENDPIPRKGTSFTPLCALREAIGFLSARILCAEARPPFLRRRLGAVVRGLLRIAASRKSKPSRIPPRFWDRSVQPGNGLSDPGQAIRQPATLEAGAISPRAGGFRLTVAKLAMPRLLLRRCFIYASIIRLNR